MTGWNAAAYHKVSGPQTSWGQKVLERLELQRAVDQLHFEPRTGKTLKLAISIGAAVFPHDGESDETLLATADSRMYRDKTRRKQARLQNGGDGRGTTLIGTTTSGATTSDVDIRRAGLGLL